ncbi:MAG: FixH family protein [Saprospiraceae bacterium]|nr:FixH family protein [Saprospiraceae bacterium]
MKLNWGTGIGIFYTLFALTMVFFVIKSTTYDNSLVVDDYYEKDLNYQEHYNRLENSQSLTEDLKIELNAKLGQVNFMFPEAMGGVKGEILFYNPTTKHKDFTVNIAPNDLNRMEVPVKDLSNGRWKIKVNWEGNGLPYYKETEIYL